MPTYLYCLLIAPTDAAAEVPRGLTGVGGEDVRRLDVDGLAAWVGTVGSRARSRSVEAARGHDRVLRAALDLGVTPLPARGGQVFAGDAACLAELASKAGALRAALERVAGCVEMTVHVALGPQSVGAEEAGGGSGRSTITGQQAAGEPPASVDRSGRQYLAKVRERLRLERNVQVEAASALLAIHAGVEALVRGESSMLHPGPQPRLTIAHLIARDDPARYREALAAVRIAHASIVHIGGPHPPYSFTELADG